MVIGLEKKSTQNTMNLLSVEPKSQIIPTISIIIPTYNNAQFLADAIESVLAQQFDALEIIVVDDGSIDHTQSVLQAYVAHVRYLYQTNAGSAVARNTALSLAGGKYIVFLDADDLLLPGKLHDQVAVLEKRPSLGLIHSGWQHVDENGNVLDVIEPWHEIPDLNLDAWVWHKPVRMGAMMFRRSWLEKVDGFDPELRQSQDVDLLLRLALAGCQADWLQKLSFSYRIYAESTTKQHAIKQHIYLMRVLDKLFADERLPAHLKAEERPIRYYSLRWIAWYFFDTGHLDGMDAPLRDAWHHSSFAPLDTIWDWAAFFLREIGMSKRPFSASTPIWPKFNIIESLVDEWPLVERYLNWVTQQAEFKNEDEAGIKQILAESWDDWVTAVSAEAILVIPAESIMNWQNLFQQDIEPSSHRNTVTVTDQLRTFNKAQNRQAAQWCIVQQPEAYSAKELAAFWIQITRPEMGLAVAGRDVVALLLTLFGQLMLRRQWRNALQTLWLAVRKTAVFPRSITHWVGFVKTAVFYAFQSNAPRSPDKNKETILE